VRLRLAFLLLLAGAVDARSGPAAILEEHLGLKADDFARLRRGDVVVRMLRNPGEREFAVMGVAELPGEPTAWNATWDGVVSLKRTSPDFIDIGRFHVPPLLEDVDRVVLAPEIARQLDKCRPEHCIYNLSLPAIERVPAETDFNMFFRRVLHEVAVGYLERGDAALPVLANRKRPITTADAAEMLLSRRPSLAELAPRLDAHFRAWRAGAPLTSEDLFFWTREKVWKREVVSLVHAAFVEEPLPVGRRRVLVERTVYANHYFRGVFTITSVLEGEKASYLVLVNRTETDNGGPFNFAERLLAGHLLKRRLSRQLRAMRDGLKSGSAAPP
jgi:hypothetical protein